MTPLVEVKIDDLTLEENIALIIVKSHTLI